MAASPNAYDCTLPVCKGAIIGHLNFTSSRRQSSWCSRGSETFEGPEKWNRNILLGVRAHYSYDCWKVWAIWLHGLRVISVCGCQGASPNRPVHTTGPWLQHLHGEADNIWGADFDQIDRKIILINKVHISIPKMYAMFSSQKWKDRIKGKFGNNF